jgi:hypothetical protein
MTGKEEVWEDKLKLLKERLSLHNAMDFEYGMDKIGVSPGLQCAILENWIDKYQADDNSRTIGGYMYFLLQLFANVEALWPFTYKDMILAEDLDLQDKINVLKATSIITDMEFYEFK